MNRDHLNEIYHDQHIQNIKQEYLKLHFEQIKSILQANYNYAFKIIKTLADILPSKMRIKLQKMIIIIQKYKSKKGVSLCRLFFTKIKQKRYQKQRSCILLQQIILRKVIPEIYTSFNQLFISKSTNQQLPKDKEMFLLLTKTNFNKLFKFMKRDTFNMIKKYSQINKTQNREDFLIKIGHIIKKSIQRQYLKAFNSILTANIIKKSSSENNQQIQSHIFIDSYKNMALNYNKMVQSQKSSIKSFKMKVAVEKINDSLTFILQKRNKWAFSDILCFQNYKYNESSLEILKKEIIILQKQFDSI